MVAYYLMDWCSWFFKLILWVWVCGFLTKRLQPAFVPANLADRRAMIELPSRIVALTHALLVSLCGVGYCLGWVNLPVLHECRLVSTAYFLHDTLQSFADFRRQERIRSAAALSVPQNSNHNNSTSPPAEEQEQKKRNKKPDPRSVLFHHVVTLLFIHAVLFGNEGRGGKEDTEAPLLAFYISEVPIITLNLTWLYIYHGRQDSRDCAIFSAVTVLSYLLLRLVAYLLIFFFVLLPRMSLLNPFSYLMMILLAFVYSMNVVWFLSLVRKTPSSVLTLIPPLIQCTAQMCQTPQ